MAVIHQRAHILEDGHRLLAVDDVLHGSLLGILTGDVVRGHIGVSSEGICDGPGGAVVRGQDEDVALVGRGCGGQVGFGQVLGGVEVPVGRDLADDLGHLVTGQRRLCPAAQSPRSEFLITKVPSAILGCSTLQAPSKKMKALLSEAAPAYRYSGLPVPLGLVNQVLGLLGAHGDAVEGHVVVDRIGVADQAVVRDHGSHRHRWAASAAAAAAVPSCGLMMITLTPLVIRSSTLAFSLADDPG